MIVFIERFDIKPSLYERSPRKAVNVDPLEYYDSIKKKDKTESSSCVEQGTIRTHGDIHFQNDTYGRLIYPKKHFRGKSSGISRTAFGTLMFEIWSIYLCLNCHSLMPVLISQPSFARGKSVHSIFTGWILAFNEIKIYATID